MVLTTTKAKLLTQFLLICLALPKSLCNQEDILGPSVNNDSASPVNMQPLKNTYNL